MLSGCHYEAPANLEHGKLNISTYRRIQIHFQIKLVTEDLGFLESFCLIGGIPVMMGMAHFRIYFMSADMPFLQASLPRSIPPSAD